MDIVDQIKIVPTTTRAGHQNVPTQPIRIQKVIIADDVLV
jgi:peptidyl-prolyl cis-trans isomerase B (cyclophilin B)